MNHFEKHLNLQEQQTPQDQKEAELRKLEIYRQELGDRLKKIKDAGGTGSQVIKKINDVEERIKNSRK